MYRLFLFVITLLALIFIIYQREKINAVVLPFTIGIFITYILNPLVEFLISKGMKRTAAVAIIYFILTGSFVIALVYIIPVIIFELNNLIDTLPFYTRETLKIISDIKTRYLVSLPQSIQEIIERNINRLQARLLDSLQKIVDAIIGIFSSIFSIILGPILGFYILKDIDKIKSSIFSYIPLEYKDKIISWFEKVGLTLGQYIRSQLIVSLLIGVLTTITMVILGVDFAFIIGALSGLTNIIPYFGPFIGAMPAITIAILRYPQKIPWIVISVLIIHQLESGIISPHIMGEHVGLHPVTVIFALLTGGTFFGILGLILAVPIAALIKLVLHTYKS